MNNHSVRARQNGAAPLKKGVVKDDNSRHYIVAPSFIRCYFRSSRIDHQFDEKEITAPRAMVSGHF